MNTIWKKLEVIMKLTNANEKVRKNHIEIKESPLGGLGVFATRDIPKNTLVTRYPIHFLMNNKSRAVSACPNLYQDLTTMPDCRDYIIKITSPELKKNYSIIADPQYKDNYDLLGHILNDKGFKKGKNTYHPEHNNCEIFGTDIYTMRNIKKDSELTFSYGEEYWFAQNEEGWSRFERLV